MDLEGCFFFFLVKLLGKNQVQGLVLAGALKEMGRR